LLAPERKAVLDVLHSERFVDSSPAAVVHTLLGEGKYLASERTMYRILNANEEVKERRNQRRHPEYKRPELMATKPNEVWSWDITRLRTTEKWVYLYLYVVLDIFSRAVVGWMVAEKETAALAAADVVCDGAAPRHVSSRKRARSTTSGPAHWCCTQTAARR